MYNSSYYALQQFIANVDKSIGLSIIHIDCIFFKINFTDVKILLLYLHFSSNVIALTKTWLNERNTDFFPWKGTVIVIEI